MWLFIAFASAAEPVGFNDARTWRVAHATGSSMPTECKGIRFLRFRLKVDQ
jgi:hypothetical protein